MKYIISCKEIYWLFYSWILFSKNSVIRFNCNFLLFFKFLPFMVRSLQFPILKHEKHTSNYQKRITKYDTIKWCSLLFFISIIFPQTKSKLRNLNKKNSKYLSHTHQKSCYLGLADWKHDIATIVDDQW
jgi:hypothetical protein